MDAMVIHSKLYDYAVSFTDCFADDFKEYGNTSVYVIDENVYELYQENMQGIPTEHAFYFKAVEENKSMDTVMQIVGFFQQAGVKKDWNVICIGGGITQDVTALASALYLRNVNWIFYPTTLLAMCDSCIGGKCGVNLGTYKNQLGVFYPPKKIRIDVGFLKTLSQADYLNGWGELLKFSLTDNEAFFEELKQEESYLPCSRIAAYIQKGLQVKKQIIEQDEFDSDLRKTLNYGHTFGHALEAYTENKVPHGTAVIWGIDVANYIAWQEGLIPEDDYLEIKSLLKREFIKKEMVIQKPERLFEIIKSDKKVKGSMVSLALLDGRSHLTIYPMDIHGRLECIVRDYLAQTHQYYEA